MASNFKLACVAILAIAIVRACMGGDDSTQSAGVPQGSQVGRTAAPLVDSLCPACGGKGQPVCGINCPLCKGTGKDKLAGIYWVSERVAKASPLDDWYFVTMGEMCSGCRQAEKLHLAPQLIAASRGYDCILIKDPSADDPWMRHYKLKMLPTDLFISQKTGHALKSVGCPQSPSGAPSLPSYLMLMKAGHEIDKPDDDLELEQKVNQAKASNRIAGDKP